MSCLIKSSIYSGVFFKYLSLNFFLVSPVVRLAEWFMEDVTVASFNNCSFKSCRHTSWGSPENDSINFDFRLYHNCLLIIKIL